MSLRSKPLNSSSILIPSRAERLLSYPVIYFGRRPFEFQYHQLRGGLPGIADAMGFRIVPHEFASLEMNGGLRLALVFLGQVSVCQGHQKDISGMRMFA